MTRKQLLLAFGGFLLLGSFSLLIASYSNLFPAERFDYFTGSFLLMVIIGLILFPFVWLHPPAPMDHQPDKDGILQMMITIYLFALSSDSISFFRTYQFDGDSMTDILAIVSLLLKLLSTAFFVPLIIWGFFLTTLPLMVKWLKR